MELLTWLYDTSPFPDPSQAFTEPNGLLAAGGDLSQQRLIQAYRSGIFPWFSSGEPILWWSPDPRMVLIPDEFKTSRSLAKYLHKTPFRICFDSAFEDVMRECAAPREGQNNTWIHEEMITAYYHLHRSGYAHSAEVWLNNNLVGGIYGVSIGRMFFGESMFSRIPNGSKIALHYLSRQLARWQFGMIDCQLYTPHLASLGAREIAREEFMTRLQELVNCEGIPHWQFDADLIP